ncbi:MAG: N-6 DNA methylase [Methanomicrobia archaeon]|nr:N-6 DNA methylase [Methanomicrobia archaeon]
MDKAERHKFQKVLATYLKELHEIYTTGDFREESFYPSLKDLFENCSQFFITEEEEAKALVLPKKTEVGIPDISIRKNGERVGDIEAKVPDSNLREIEKTEQIQRYRDALPNLILTNFVEFRRYRNGAFIEQVDLCSPTALQGVKPPVPENVDAFFEFIERFCSFSVPEIQSASALAIVLADKTRFSRQILKEVFERKDRDSIPLESFYVVFKKTLIGGLTEERFVDLYAQTITYGLFAARIMAGKEQITKENAWKFIPGNVPLLNHIFHTFVGPDTPEAMNWIIEDILNVLNKTDVVAITQEKEATYGTRDPVIHFYDTFLGEYNPEERAKLGVYYTPPEVVDYIVKSIHNLLKEKFGKGKGLAEEGLKLLDPAAGTLTFIIQALRKAEFELLDNRMGGLIPLNIKNHILADFYAFELQVVPYIIGHLRVAMSLEAWEYEFSKDERFQFYLTNTLEMKEPEQELLLPQLTEEGREAMNVKEKEPILVVLGNPPYFGMSENKGEWILGLIEDYKQVDGKPLGEKNPKWLQDDYVKFIRFGQWKIDRTGEGVLGFITNHSYLDNPTFRGMRQSLMKSFDEIYILNLHGNSLKKEKCPDGSKDENVFDIRPGVAIGLFIKKKGTKEKGERNARVFYADLWGLRENKYKWLLRNDRTTTEWEELKPKSPFYFFVPIKDTYWDEYANSWKITDIMPTNSVGIVTARDKLTVQDSPEKVWKTVLDFAALPEETARSKYGCGRDAQDWKVSLAQDDLKRSGLKRELIVPVLYRPFDIKHTYYTGRSRGFICRPRLEVMPHMLHENLGLLYTRPQSPKYEFSVIVSAEMIDQCSIGNKSAGAGISYIAPLYLYPDKTTRKLTDEKTSAPECTPNFSKEFLKAITEALGTELTPEAIFYYIYAVFYSPTYRKRYEEFLKIDFPRVPLPTDYELFKNLSALGKELVDLHLLQHPSLSETGVGFPVSGTNTVEKVSYDEENEWVYFNKTQYFDGISKAVWDYQIGGYQVLMKYLKDRKGRELTWEEIVHYMKVAAAIRRTIVVQEEIDGVMKF